MPNGRGTDRRVQRTQGLLHGALAALIHEKAYDAIVVKEILARANVGRSTFYTHFRDKDELLESGMRGMLRASETAAPVRSTGLAERILRFSLPMFEHIERYRGASDVSVDVQGQAVVHEHLQRVLVESITEDLRRAGPRRQESGHNVPSDLIAEYVASTFLLVLNWWMESEEPLPSRKVNDLYRALILPTLTEVLD
jgi:AcrR family transcriptional regulator